MLVRTCDFCKKIIATDAHSVGFGFRFSILDHSQSDNNNLYAFDACDSCLKNILNKLDLLQSNGGSTDVS